MSLLETIKGRGYWEVVIRPARFVEKRASKNELAEIVRTQQVRFRGWYFPHWDGKEKKLSDHIEQEVPLFLSEVETWRFYQSGLFVYFKGMRGDWLERPPPGTADLNPRPLSVEDTVYTLSEALEFAARLARSKAGDNLMHVAATLHGLRGRRLLSSSWMGAPPTPCDEDVLPMSGEFSREQLAAEARGIAANWAREVFDLFGWDPPAEILQETQAQFREP